MSGNGLIEMQLSASFETFDRMPPNRGFTAAIQAADESLWFLRQMGVKLAEASESGGEVPVYKALGALAQLWEDPKLGIPQKPSSLGQAVVLGGLGALGGKYLGKGVDYVLPNDVVKAERAGLILGGLLGVSPGAFGAFMNAQSGKPIFTSSYYNTKNSSFGRDPFATASINVQDFQNQIWNDPRMKDVPLPLRAGASGLVQGASNLSHKHRNSSFVTPLDIARVSMGMGSGLASGWVVGKTLGGLFGTGQKTQDLIKNTGIALGALKTVIPMAFGGGPYE